MLPGRAVPRQELAAQSFQLYSAYIELETRLPCSRACLQSGLPNKDFCGGALDALRLSC